MELEKEQETTQQERDAKENKKPTLTGIRKWLIIAGLAMLLVVAILIVFSCGSGETTIEVESLLKEVIMASDLRTAEYTYNGIAEAKEKDELKYYVRYKGTVTVGIDFSNVRVKREGDTIQVIVPEIKINSLSIQDDLDYIFAKEKYNTESVSAEADGLCKADLEAEAKNNQTLFDTAKESAESTLKALIKPFESMLAEGERFEIVFETTKEGDTQ